MSRNVLVVSAHPDDEILGAGGALLRHHENGDKLAWVIITEINESSGFDQDRIKRRDYEIDFIKDRLNMQVYKLGYNTASLTNNDLITLIPKISDVFTEFKPHTVYVMNRSDAHSDHRITFDAVMACTKAFRYPYIREVLMYECISETEFAPPLYEKAFIPNYFIDISDKMEEKLELMKIYESELGDPPFPRSLENIKALATFRGASCGVKFAEAFQVVRIHRIEQV